MKEIEQWNHFSHNNFIWKYKFVGVFYFSLYALRLYPLSRVLSSVRNAIYNLNKQKKNKPTSDKTEGSVFSLYEIKIESVHPSPYEVIKICSGHILLWLFPTFRCETHYNLFKNSWNIKADL